MISISDVATVIKRLGEVVKSTRDIVEAVNDGRKFLELRYPKAQPDMSELLGQMQYTIEGLAEVTKVISGFRFVIDERINMNNEIGGSELARFNDYVIEQKTAITKLKNNIRKLKANCDKVRELRDKLNEQTSSRSWGSMFDLLGLGAKEQQRSHELYGTISNFYADDQMMINLIEQTLKLAQRAIMDVQRVLGPRGAASPYNIPMASAILGIYAAVFDKPYDELHELADSLSEAQTALRS